MKHAWFTIGLAAGLLCMLTRPASVQAHALGAQCTPKGDKVHVEAYFEDDTPAQQALVRVVDSEQQEVAKGQTDAKGLWSFETPPPGRYEVIVDAGAGHRVVQKLTIAERGGSPTGSPADSPAGSPSSSAPGSDAPTREEFTRFPWLKVMLGVGTIALLAMAFLLSRRGSAAPPQ